MRAAAIEPARQVRPLTPERWPDLELVMEPTGRAGCWCMWWRLARGPLTAGAVNWGGFPGHRRGRSAARPCSAAWSASRSPGPGEPEPVLPTLARSRGRRSSGLALSCFMVTQGHRRQGLTARMIAAAQNFARAARAALLKAWATDEP